VLTAVTELGYVPSGAARDLAARRTGVLGLCFPDLDTEDGDGAYWYDEVIRGMERAARRRGYAVLIAASHHRDDSGLVLSIAGRCDGLVVLARTAPQAMIAGGSPSGSSPPGECRAHWSAPTTRPRSGSWRRCSKPA
jgi:LacI family transcriptional regulator